MKEALASLYLAAQDERLAAIAIRSMDDLKRAAREDAEVSERWLRDLPGKVKAAMDPPFRVALKAHPYFDDVMKTAYRETMERVKKFSLLANAEDKYLSDSFDYHRQALDDPENYADGQINKYDMAYDDIGRALEPFDKKADLFLTRWTEKYIYYGKLKPLVDPQDEPRLKAAWHELLEGYTHKPFGAIMKRFAEDIQDLRGR